MSAPSPKPPARSPEARAQPITSMSSEEQNFHRLFPDVPPNEKLVEWCQCGLTRKMLVRMGKLYLTSLRLCFQSSFLDSIIVIPWEDVASVEKRTSFMFDAIVVTNRVTREDFSFTAFIGGGISQMLKLMKTLWSVRERYAASEAASLSRAAQTAEATDDLASSGSDNSDDGNEDDDDEDDDMSSGRTDISDFTEGVVGRRTSQSPLDDRSSLGFRGVHSREVSITPKQLRIAEVLQSGGGGDGGPLTSPTAPAIHLANDPIVGDAKKKKPTALAPATPISAKSPGEQVSALTQEARSLFPKLPPTETVADSFQCSCVSGVHRLGKMYITQRFILFASVMMEENLQLSFEDVESIEKEQTMMILDGIAIRLKNAKRAISFTSFVSRDAVYNTLLFFFSNVKKEKEAKESEAPEDAADDGPPSFKTATSEYDLSKLPSAASLDEFSKVATDWGTAFSDYACFTKEVTKPLELPRGRSVLEVFRRCFDDRTRVLEEYHKQRKDSAMACEDWRATTDGQPFRGQRLFTCTTLVKAMMGKACPYTEYQRYAFFNVGGTTPTLVVQFSSQIAGVMFSDAFRAEALVVFTQAGKDDAATVTMRAYGYVQFLRSVWVKGKIQSKTLDDELPQSYNTLGKMIEVALNAGGDEAATSGDADAPVVPMVDSTSERASNGTGSGATSSGEARPVLPPQTAAAQRVMSWASVGLAALVMLCALRGALGAFFASLPRDGVICSFVLGALDGSDAGATSAASVYALLGIDATADIGQQVCSRVSETEGYVLHYLRAPLLAFHLLVLIGFAGVLARVAAQL